MNQESEPDLQNQIQNSQEIILKMKNKKAKDPTEPADDVAILNQETLTESLANTLHLNKLNSNITNGTSDHLQGSGSPASPEDSLPRDVALSEANSHVNNVHCSEAAGDGTEEPQTSSGQMHIVRNLVEEALENLENALSMQEKPNDEIEIISYESELQMPEIMRLIQKDLSEPYSIYTYRYFIHNWPKLCFLATFEEKCIGAIVCKLDMHRNVVKRGYIAMLAVDENYRKKKIGSRLVQKAIQAMINDNADEVVLETEITNKPALKLYENLGFVRDKRLFRYYLNGVDALRLKLWLR